MPAMPIAESSAPIVVGASATSSAIRVAIEIARVRVTRERSECHHDGEEDQRQSGEQDPERDLVRGLAPLGALDERDHPIQEALAGALSDLDEDPVGQHACASGHGGPVTAGRAHDRGGLAGHGRLVDRGDPSMIVPSPGISSPAAT